MCECGSNDSVVTIVAVGMPPVFLQQDVICGELVFNNGEDVVLEETGLRAPAFGLCLALFFTLLNIYRER